MITRYRRTRELLPEARGILLGVALGSGFWLVIWLAIEELVR